MDTKEIIEGNQLIAEFMGYDFIAENSHFIVRESDYLEPYHHKFNSSWDWLMPVVEKIDLMGFDVQISRISIKISRILENENPIISLVCGDVSQKLDLCFLAVVEFIQWYNQNKEL